MTDSAYQTILTRLHQEVVAGTVCTGWPGCLGQVLELHADRTRIDISLLGTVGW